MVKLLIVEDDPVIQQSVKKELASEELEFLEAHTGIDALGVIRDREVRIAIIDWMIPGLNGENLCKEIRKLKQKRYVYLIVLATKSEKFDTVSVLEYADDILLKPFDGREILSRIAIARRVLALQDKLFDAQKEVMRLAKEDPLTTLLNRRALFDEIIKELNRTVREELPLSTILVDIDDLKKINEKYGYAVGDKVLIEASERLKRICRPYDSIGRYGGGEFFILLPNTKKINATMVAERMKKAIGGKPFSIEDKSVAISASFGVCYFRLEHEKSEKFILEHVLDDIIYKTDEALLRAKAEGKKVFVFTD